MDDFAAALHDFLEHAPRGVLRYAELQGFLFAVANAPDVVLPSEWIPVVFNDDEPEFADRNEAQVITTALMEEFNRVSGAHSKGILPPGYIVRDDPMSNFADDAPLGRWSRGFVSGHRWLTETWEKYLRAADTRADRDPDEPTLSNSLGAQMLVLSFFASRDMAEEMCGAVGEEDFQTFTTRVHGMLPGAAREYAELGRSLQRDFEKVSMPRRRASPKVGRNDPCPCGSGKKFKRCCAAA